MTPVRFSDFLKLAAPASSACRSSLTSAARTPDDASASDHARKRQGDAKVLLKLPIGTTAMRTADQRKTCDTPSSSITCASTWLASAQAVEEGAGAQHAIMPGT